MGWLPIVERELRARARQPRTYWIRLAAAGGGSIICFWMLATLLEGGGRIINPSIIGPTLFMTLGWLLFVLCALVGIAEAADCLSREMREGTLGLLFLTDLRGLDVVLGKLAATSIITLLALIGTFPVLVVPILLGGVSGGEVVRAAIALMDTLFVSLALSIAASSVSREQGRAGGLALLGVSLFTALVPVLAELVEIYSYPAAVVLNLLSPGHLFYSAFQAGYVAIEFWSGALCTFMLGAGAIWFASIKLPHAWQDRPAGTAKLRWQDRWRQWTCGNGAIRAEHRRHLLEINPVYWIAFRERFKPYLVWLLMVGSVLVFGGLTVALDLLNTRLSLMEFLVIWLAGTHSLHFVLKMWVAAEAGRRFARDREEGAIELLAATSLKTPEILHGLELALRRQFTRPIVLLLSLEAVFMLAMMSSWAGEDGEVLPFLTFALCASTIIFLLDVFAAARTAIWFGLVTCSTNKASFAVLWRIIVLPWGIIWLFTCLGLDHPAGYLLVYFMASGFIGAACSALYGSKTLRFFRLLAVNPGVKLKDLQREMDNLVFEEEMHRR